MLLTEHQVITIGTHLSQFIRTDAWEVTVKVLEEYITNKILTSGPLEQEVRENHYQLHRALRELIATIDGIAIQAEQLLAESDPAITLDEQE